MATYLELKAQAEKMMQEAELLRKQESADLIVEIKTKIKEYGLTAADLGFSGSGIPSSRKPAKSKSDAPAKYRGPNGELWAGGLGRKPQWVVDVLAQGKNIDDFLI